MSDPGQPVDPNQPIPPGYGPRPQYGPPSYGQPPSYDQPQYGQPPAYDQPQYGQPPTYGQPEYGQPQYGQPPIYGPPQYPTQAFGGVPPYGPPPGNVAAGPGSSGGGRRRGVFIGAGVVVVAALVILGVVLFTGGSSGASTPAAAVRTVLDAGKSLNYAKIRSSLCAADQRLPEFTAPSASDRVQSYSVGATHQTDSTHATVDVRVVSASDPTPNTASIPVVIEGSSWKVCVSSLLGTLPSTIPTPGSGSASSSGQPSSPPSFTPPSGLPSLTLPSGLPPSLGDLCAGSDGEVTASIFIEAAAEGETAIANSCVSGSGVSAQAVAALQGHGLFTPSLSGNSGSMFAFTSTDGKVSATVTTTQGADGRFHITALSVH